MRTILFIGFLTIAGAINPNCIKEDQQVLYIFVFTGAIICDIYVTIQRDNKRK